MDIIANGTRLQYIESGNGYPVVCLHGNGLNRDLWRHFIPELSKQYRAIAYDLRGMGKSEAPGKQGVTHTIEDHARDFEEFLDGLGIDHAAIVGHAFGGFVAMRVAIDRPERVSTMVLVNSTAKSPTGGEAPRWARTAESEGMEPLLDNQMARWFLERVHRDQPQVIQFYREMLGANPPMGYAANSRGVALMDLRSQLNGIKCPTLIIGGKEDKSIPPSVNEQNAAKIPGAQLAFIANASHIVPEEQPEEFNRTTLEFLEQNIARVFQA